MWTRLFMILMTCLLFGCGKEDVQVSNELKGQWYWKSTCGGVVGCINSSPVDQMTMKISETDIVTTVSNKNGANSTSESYQLIDKQLNGGDTIYKIKFANGTILTMTVNNNTLYSTPISVYPITSAYNRK